MKSLKRIRDEGTEAGFDDRKIEFLLENFTPPGHHHDANQIDDLEEAVNKIVDDEYAGEDMDDEEDDDEEPEHSRYLDE